MVATSDCVNTKTVTGKKVSKPLMEKKRRARINKCLDQLKTLLENHHHTNNIRKRKLEKADILELTVRHLKYLQKIQCGSSVNSEVSDYQAGFRSCLSAVNQYLLMADNSKGSSRLCMVTHLSSNLLCAGGQALKSSTTDSDLGKQRGEEAELLRLPPTVEASKAESPAPLARCVRSLNPHHSTAHVSHAHARPTETGERLSLAASQVFATAYTQTTQEEKSLSSLHKNKDHSIVQCRNEVVASISQDVWRPW